jgi:outer membrane immunogenic protein
VRRVLLAFGALVALSSASSASDLPGRAVAPPSTAAQATWTGFYVGAHHGFHGGDTTFRVHSYLNFFENFDDSTYLPSGDLDNNTVMSGAQAGFNLQTGRFVLGVEADVSVFGKAHTTTFITRYVSAVDSFPVTTEVRSRLDYLGTARGRLGVAFDHLLVYATAGAAIGNPDYSVAYEEKASRNVPYIGAGQLSGPQLGYVVGGGLEYAFTNSLSLKAEYLYYNLGDGLVNTRLIGERGEAFTHKIETGGHIGRVGINFRL